MALTKNQKIGAGIGAAALLLLLLGNRKKWFKKDETVVDAPVSTSNTTTPYKTVSNADGSPITIEDKATEMYKALIGTIAYVRTGKDEQAQQLRDAIAEQVMAKGVSQDRLLLEFAIKMNKGKEGLKEAVKMINKDVSGHVEYFLDNKKFLIEAK